MHLLQCVRLTAGALTARTSASVTMAAPATECQGPVCAPQATPAPLVKTGVQKAHTASGVSTAAYVSTAAHASTTPARASASQVLPAPSVRQVSHGERTSPDVSVFDVNLVAGPLRSHRYYYLLSSRQQ